MSTAAGAVGVALSLLLTGMPATAATTTPTNLAAHDPAALVDPFIGTGSGGAVVGDVDTFPGAALPFGMVQFSPDTPAVQPVVGIRTRTARSPASA